MNINRLRRMKYVLLFFTAMWGMLQQGLQDQGKIPEVDDFSYLEYAHETFIAMCSYLPA